MFDKDLFLSICKEYDVELSETADSPMLKSGEAMMNITDINFAIDILSHPQSGDESDINIALNIAIESLKAMKEVVKQ